MGNCNKFCALDYHKSEEYINTEFNNSIFIKNIPFNLIELSIRKKANPSGVKSMYINQERFEDAINYLMPKSNNYYSKFNSDKKVNINTLFVKKILLNVFNFLDSSNKNNLDILLLYLFPVFTQNFKNKKEIKKEFFYLISNSQLEEGFDNFEIPKHYYKDAHGRKKNTRPEKIREWMRNPLMMNIRKFNEILSSYISTILIGYSLVFRDFFKESKEDLLFEDISSNISMNFKGGDLREFFEFLVKDFNQKIMEESFKWDVDFDDMFFTYEEFEENFSRCEYLFDFMKLRLEYFDFVKKNQERKKGLFDK